MMSADVSGRLGMVAACALALASLGGCPDPTDTQETQEPGGGVDADGDGYTVAQGDCNDHASLVNPGMEEVCDEADRDENCNGVADNDDDTTSEASQTRWYRDVDLDGYGDPDSSRLACDDPSTTDTWWSRTGDDCDDRDPAQSPAGQEVCNGQDDDCDGSTDEGTECATPTPPEPTPTVFPWETPRPQPEATPDPGATPDLSEPTPPEDLPTAPPGSDEIQGLTLLQILDEGEGLDLTGDGQVDNNIDYALEVLRDVLQDNIDETIDSFTDTGSPDDECKQGDTNTCVFTAASAAAAKRQAADILEESVTVERINESLAVAFSLNDQGSSTAVEFDTSLPGLRFYEGGLGLQSTGYYGWKAEVELGVQPGAIEPAGALSRFGPGSFLFDFELGSVGYRLEVYDARTELRFNALSTRGALIGGGVKVRELADIAESVIVAFVDKGIISQAEGQAILSAVDQSLVEACDITCSDGDPCFSIGLTFDAEHIELAEGL